MEQKMEQRRSGTGPDYGVGVDIGGTKIWIHVADADGRVVCKRKVATSNKPEEITRLVMETLSQASIPMERVAAIGFGVPGIADTRNGIVIDAPALEWSNFPFVTVMSRYFNKPVFVDNDVNCAALGERWTGSAQTLNDFVFLAIGTGVGSAIVANGSLIYGSHYMAGEIAYMVLDDDVLAGQSNAFGRFGLYENRISGTALSRHGYSSDQLFSRSRDGDEKARQIVSRFVADLAIGISNIASLLNPQKVILGGGVSQSLPQHMDAIRSLVARLTPVPVIIELSGLGEQAGAMGAAAIAFERVGLLKGIGAS